MPSARGPVTRHRADCNCCCWMFGIRPSACRMATYRDTLAKMMLALWSRASAGSKATTG